ncbi:hypothetical protein ACLI4Y_07995 [Natrialbaceae archaeon A-CW3]
MRTVLGNPIGPLSRRSPATEPARRDDNDPDYSPTNGLTLPSRLVRSRRSLTRPSRAIDRALSPVLERGPARARESLTDR